MAENSIYRGKAINSKREFLDLTNVNPNELIFGPKLEREVSVNIYTPIAKREACREAGIPFKRGILLMGPFGGGKTLTGLNTAALARQHGVTFINGLIEDGIPKTMTFAKQYQPAVVFMEDIDRKADDGEELSEVLDVLDGILAKDADVMVIFTTNYPEKIDLAARRHGRIDALIHVGHPEPEAIEKLIRRYARGLVADDTNLDGAVRACNGMSAASIREVVERSKLAAIDRSDSAENITCEDLVVTAGMLRPHLDYMKSKVESKRTVKLLAEVNDGNVNTDRGGANVELEEEKSEGTW